MNKQGDSRKEKLGKIAYLERLIILFQRVQSRNGRSIPEERDSCISQTVGLLRRFFILKSKLVSDEFT